MMRQGPGLKAGLIFTMNLKFFLSVIGMVLIIEGLPYFAFPRQIKGWLKQIMDAPEGVLRGVGFVGMVIGLTLLYFGRSQVF